jgi:FtsP/CotA-like multicopper oxidase with cupredoxin domain
LHFWIIQSIVGAIAVTLHPIHLYGHDFYLIRSGTGTFTDPSEVAMLPAGGWLVLAFETNNPGAWLMH